MSIRRTLVLTMLAVGLIAVAPGVADRVARAERSLQRAQDKADDGDTAGAASALSSVRKNLASALKSAKKRVVAGNDTGPDAIGAVTGAQHDVIVGTAGLFDGQTDGSLVQSIADTLKAALDGRDEAIAAIAALPAADQSNYEYVLEQIDSDIADDIDAVDSALSDDTLTPEATAALNDAKAQLTASQTSVQALSASTSAASTSDSSDTAGSNGNGRNCPHDGNDSNTSASSRSRT